MDVTNIFLSVHSIVRFGILLLALVGIVLSVANLVRHAAPTGADRAVGSAFLGLYDLQVLLGLLIILFGGLTQAIHPVIMFVGVVLAHGLQRAGKQMPADRANLTQLAFYVFPLLVILVGLATISRLPY